MRQSRILHVGLMALIFCAQLFLMVVVSGAVRGDVESSFTSASGSSPGTCRLGVATLSDSQVDWVDNLHAGWYLDFSPSAVAATNGAEFTPVVTVQQDRLPNGTLLESYSTYPALTEESLGHLISLYPNALWVAGNEVDRQAEPDPNTGIRAPKGAEPHIYARAYHDIYHFIKDHDPNAQVAISGLVEVTPGRLQYLDKFWEAYIDYYGNIPPVDVWNMHLYILPEVNPDGEPNTIANVAMDTDPALGKMESGGEPSKCKKDDIYCFAEHDDMDIFQEQVVAMRTWMKQHGQQNKPLILSEWSLLYPYEQDPGSCYLQDEYGNCFTPERVTQYLNNSVDSLYWDPAISIDFYLGYPKDGYRLIQQSLWFSVNNTGGVGYVSNLVENGALTLPGTVFKNQAEAIPNSKNLFPIATSGSALFSNGGFADAELQTKILNNGNMAPGIPFEVTFYDNPNLAGPAIGSVTVDPPDGHNPGMTGCARRVEVVGVTWYGLAPGVHHYWVKVDSENVITENAGNGETDNVISGVVIVDPDYQTFMPSFAN